MGGISTQKFIANKDDKARPERWQSVVALEKMGKPVVEYLVPPRKDEDKWVRYNTTGAPGTIGNGCYGDHLIGSPENHDQGVRFVTAAALWKTGESEGLQCIKTHIRSV